MKIFKKSNKVQKNPIKSGLIRINPPGLDFLQIIRIFCNPAVEYTGSAMISLLRLPFWPLKEFKFSKNFRGAPGR